MGKTIYEKCDYSRSGNSCLVNRCPLNNKAFNKSLDKWALLGRAPKGSNPAPSIAYGHDPEWAMLRKCRITMLFKDEQLILDWIITGKMTKEICMELVRGEKKFRQIRWKEKYNQP